MKKIVPEKILHWYEERYYIYRVKKFLREKESPLVSFLEIAIITGWDIDRVTEVNRRCLEKGLVKRRFRDWVKATVPDGKYDGV